MAKVKGGLGRGLEALIRPAVERPQTVPPEETTSHMVARPGSEISEIAIAKIRPNPYQPRADFDETALDELKRSIIEKGIIQPITVRRIPSGEYELVSGERRVRAAMEAGLKEIPAYIIEVKRDEEMLELALIENLQREHLNPIEIAISYRRLITECNLTQEEVAQKISKDRTTVTNFLRLLKLPEKIQTALRKNQLTPGHARALVAIEDEKTQLKIFDRIIKKGLNVRQVEEIVRTLGKKKEPKTPAAARLPAGTLSAISSIEERIRNTLATKVKVVPKGGGKGEIIIEYYSNDDLDRLLELFSIIEKYNV
jgi:ParB family chromosome partitioning protein